MPYAFFDGDNVGNTIEILLIENKVDEATLLSRHINDAVYQLKIKLKKNSDVDVIILGGDDLLIKYDIDNDDIGLLEDIREIFKSTTGLNMSCGVGSTISEAIQNLHLAKLYGKNQLIGLG